MENSITLDGYIFTPAIAHPSLKGKRVESGDEHSALKMQGRWPPSERLLSELRALVATVKETQEKTGTQFASNQIYLLSGVESDCSTNADGGFLTIDVDDFPFHKRDASEFVIAHELGHMHYGDHQIQKDYAAWKNSLKRLLLLHHDWVHHKDETRKKLLGTDLTTPEIYLAMQEMVSLVQKTNPYPTRWHTESLLKSMCDNPDFEPKIRRALASIRPHAQAVSTIAELQRRGDAKMQSSNPQEFQPEEVEYIDKAFDEILTPAIEKIWQVWDQLSNYRRALEFRADDFAVSKVGTARGLQDYSHYMKTPNGGMLSFILGDRVDQCLDYPEPVHRLMRSRSTQHQVAIRQERSALPSEFRGL